MFNWFSSGTTGASSLKEMRAEFGQMLDEGRHMYDAAANAFLGGTDLEVIRDDLFDTDKRINAAEQRIRRQIVVHATVHGTPSFPACLVLMSVVKDAERVGDYAKNIFDLAELSPKLPPGKYRDDLVKLKDRISELMARCRETFDKQDTETAQKIIGRLEEAEDHCDKQISQLLTTDQGTELSATYALSYRYFKRVASHVFNVLTSIVQPIDKIDFSDGD